MNDTPTVDLGRDCEAVQIPAGNTVVLPAGTAVEITQQLGGEFTVFAMGALFRISRANADALGIALTQEVAAAEEGPVTEEKLWAALKNCYDPEIPVNIVDLGLVYGLEVHPLPEGNVRVQARMTLTAPGCGMGPMIARDAEEKLKQVSGVREAAVELVWDPPWQPSRISAEGRRVLGLE